jgi:hypothetical protein
MNRRDFIGGSIAAGVAAGLPKPAPKFENYTFEYSEAGKDAFKGLERLLRQRREAAMQQMGDYEEKFLWGST